MVYNPYITRWFNPLYNPTNQGFFRGSFENYANVNLDHFPRDRGENTESVKFHHLVLVVEGL